jgi:S-layer protein
MAITATTRTAIIELVVGMFGAAPGADNLSALATASEKGTTLKQLASNLENATFNSIYPTFLDNQEFANRLIDNLVGTEVASADKASAATMLVAMLTAGASRSSVILDAINGLKAVASTNTAWINGATVFNNKVAVATYFTVEKQQNASTLADLQKAIATVTSAAASVTAAKTAVDTSGSVGKSFTLTTGVDAGAAFTGGSGDDTFSAGDVAGAAVWTTGDAVNGGLGNDIFNVTSNAAINSPTAATVTGVETANLVSGTTGSVINTTGWTGLTALNVNAPTNITATAAATTAVSVTGSAATGTVIVNGGSTVAVTSTDANAGTISIGATTASAGAVTVTSTGVAAGSTTGNAITVKGGTTINITQVGGNVVNTTNNAGAVTVTGTAATTSVTVTSTKAQTASATKIGQGAGSVTISDVNTASATAAGTITSATVSNYSTFGFAGTALTTLSLTGGAGNMTIVNSGLTTATNKTLGLTVNGLTGGILDDADIYTTLNITGTGAAATLADITFAATTALNVDGTTAVTAASVAGLTALTTVTSTNTGGLNLGSAIGTGVTFTGGAGFDSVSIGTTTKAITMGAGDDTVTTSSAAVGTGGSVAAGDGTDTIVMTSALAAGADDNSTFNSKFTGFEVLRLSDTLAAKTTLNLTGLNAVSKVELALGGDDAATAVIDNLVSGGTVQTEASSTGITIQVKDATFNAADTLNLAIKAAAITTTATVTAAGVETLNISAADATTAGGTAVVHVISTLTAAAATTINVSGNNGLTITAATGSTKVATFNASGVVPNGTADTGALLAVTYTSLNTSSAVSITGGAGNDVLTAAAASTKVQTITGGNGADVITGGAANDIIDLTETTAAIDTVIFLNAASNGVDAITGFAAGTGVDLASVLAANTTVATGAGVAVSGATASATLTTGAAAFALTGANSTTSDVVEITTVLSSYGNLGLAGATSGIELLKALSSTDSAATSITATAAGDDFYLVAYQSGNAYLYQVSNDGDAAVASSEIALVGVFNGVASGAFASGDFLVYA